VQWRFKLSLANGSMARLESMRPAPLWSNTVRKSLHEHFGMDAVSVQCSTWKPVIVENRTFRKKTA